MASLLSRMGSFFIPGIPRRFSSKPVSEIGQNGAQLQGNPTHGSGAGENGVELFSWRKLLHFMGPGFLMAIAYIDPGNLESDLQAGSRTGYTLCWVLLWSTVMGYLVQLLAARLGVVTGEHLAQHCRRVYPPVARSVLWIMMEVAIIGSDIQEVIGSAIALSLLSSGKIPLTAGVVLTAVLTFFLLLIEQRGMRHLEAFIAALVGVMTMSFGAMFFMASIPYGEVATATILPRLPLSELSTAVGIVGAVIMPHNIYLHSALVQSRKVDPHLVVAKREAILYFGVESAIALFVTLCINIAVLAVFSRGFHNRPLDIGLENAGDYLGERFGFAMKYIWAVGLLAAGQSSTMTGTYTGQFVMSGFLDWKLVAWKRVLITRSVAICPTLLVAILSRNSSELDVMNQLLNILQSIQLPFAVIPVLKLTSNRRVMGEFVNSRAMKISCWGIAILVMLINLFMFQTNIQGVFYTKWYLLVPSVCAIVCYVLFVGYLAVGPEWYSARMAQLHKSFKSMASLASSCGEGSVDHDTEQPLLNGHHRTPHDDDDDDATPFAAAANGTV